MNATFRLNPRTNARALACAIALTVGVGLTAPQPATAQWVVTDPGHTIQTIISEGKRAADAAADYAAQAQQLQTQIRQYEDMVKQGLSLADPRFDSLQGTLKIGRASCRERV